MSEHEYDFEPVRGLPEKLPAGETILWQGSPRASSLALQAYRIRAIAIYFGVLVVWRFVYTGGVVVAVPDALLGTSWLLMLACVALGVISLLAWLGARSTVYTLTNRRIVIRHGIALPMTVNIPFAVIESADVKLQASGIGEIALLLTRDQRVGYLLTWPNVRPWQFTRVQPALRAIAGAQQVAQLLGSALSRSSADTKTDALPAVAPPTLAPPLAARVFPRSNVAA